MGMMARSRWLSTLLHVVAALLACPLGFGYGLWQRRVSLWQTILVPMGLSIAATLVVIGLLCLLATGIAAVVKRGTAAPAPSPRAAQEWVPTTTKTYTFTLPSFEGAGGRGGRRELGGSTPVTYIVMPTGGFITNRSTKDVRCRADDGTTLTQTQGVLVSPGASLTMGEEVRLGWQCIAVDGVSGQGSRLWYPFEAGEAIRVIDETSTSHGALSPLSPTTVHCRHGDTEFTTTRALTGTLTPTELCYAAAATATSLVLSGAATTASSFVIGGTGAATMAPLSLSAGGTGTAQFTPAP